MCPQLLDNDFNIGVEPYVVPQIVGRSKRFWEEHIKILGNYNNIDSAEIFGLHKNVDISARI